ncbi:MAG: NAD(P)H-hydrate dehydratase [Phenylobacterium sp.]|uniref:NAD(P)H-hydrate dehydratase n=1 Tax=Phenylobacterium sp. TaxID=1871053 RepID=UPI00271EF9FA|nr:NAD(P)H-hydrate dehydratase [Phenylobacterium sp.]MDO8899956.1 NAD(P)H-hydrate dehydratase [Phenylobacterium sp.]
MAAADRAAVVAGTPAIALMERAGAAVADAVLSRFAPCETLVLCGPGDNGGDGYVVARLLAEQGWPVRVAALASPRTDSAKAMATLWTGVTTDIQEEIQATLYIDALFGAGLSGPLTGDAARVVHHLNATPERVVAIDTPSGLPGDTGLPQGVCGRAGLTVTFHARKPAHVLEPGRGRCGEVVVADIGLGESAATLFENTPELWAPRFPWPTAASHKHARGRMVVVSGPAWSTGAARLAARAGLRIGAGLVTVLSPPDALSINATHLEAVMLRPFDSEAELETLATDVDAAVIGPAAGINETTLMNVLALARTGAALILDADAITVFRQDPEELFSVLDRDDVLTPHPGEFERLFPGILDSAPERISATRRAAELADAVVLLKGPDTVVASPDGRAAVSLNGSPWLATAGTGDVLAGYIAGLVAQGMDSFEAACAGAWIHAEAAQSHGPGLIAEDLPGLTPAVLRRLYTGT